MRLLALALLSVPLLASSQTGPSGGTAQPDAEAHTTALFSFASMADSLRAGPQAPHEADRAISLAVSVELAGPTVYAFGITGASVTLPAGWDREPSVAEDALPEYAVYTVANDVDGHPLAGVVLRVERVTGLNPLLRERWLHGQTMTGYHGTGPVGPAEVPEGFGVEIAGRGVGGVVAFVQRGPVLWAVSVEAPAATWAAQRAEVAAVLAAVRLP